MSIKKKILAGILSGAMIFGVGTSFNSVYAEPPAPEQEQQQEFDGKGHRPNRPQMTEEQINEYAKEIADYYGLDQAEISTAIKNHVHFEDIRQAVLANKKISNDENSTNTKNKPEVIKEIERKRNKRKTNKTILMEALNEAEKWKKSQLS